MARVPFTTNIEEDLVKEIKKLAIDLGKNVNDILEDCIRRILKDPKKQDKPSK